MSDELDDIEYLIEAPYKQKEIKKGVRVLINIAIIFINNTYTLLGVIFAKWQ